MGTVSGFVAVFVPIGNFECAIGPLSDTALYLLTTGAPVRIDRKSVKRGNQTLPP